MSAAACLRCLRRAELLARLAPFIERVATGERGSGSPALLALGDEELARAVGGERGLGVLVEVRRRPAAWHRERARRAQCWTTCRHDGAYPPSLRDLGPEAPAALFGVGDLALLAELGREEAVTVVGARRASAYGRQVARGLGRMLATARLTVVSGMAFGVDADAHRGALEGTAVPLAVLGCGADRPYPRTLHRLHRELAERGAVVSELPPGAPPFRWTFPARNRIMAGLGRMTVVVEAAERSGSLITAEMASEYGRDVGAVPGPVDSWLSAGTNRLLREGATVVRDAQDVLDEMLGPGARVVRDQGPSLAPELVALRDLIDGRSSADAVAAAAQMPVAEVAAGLARLELLGYLRADAVGIYERTALVPPPAG